jgi:hypothetical protein
MLSRQPITDANYEAAMASCAGRAIVSNVKANPRIVTVESMAEWIRDRQYVTQDILDRTYTKSEQRLFPAARERALRLSGDLN